MIKFDTYKSLTMSKKTQKKVATAFGTLVGLVAAVIDRIGASSKEGVMEAIDKKKRNYFLLKAIGK